MNQRLIWSNGFEINYSKNDGKFNEHFLLILTHNILLENECLEILFSFISQATHTTTYSTDSSFSIILCLLNEIFDNSGFWDSFSDSEIRWATIPTVMEYYVSGVEWELALTEGHDWFAER